MKTIKARWVQFYDNTTLVWYLVRICDERYISKINNNSIMLINLDKCHFTVKGISGDDYELVGFESLKDAKKFVEHYNAEELKKEGYQLEVVE